MIYWNSIEINGVLKTKMSTGNLQRFKKGIAAKKTNIIYILVDDVGMGDLGSPILNV
jgi:hypothetical protein